jgi:hypothetical protein
MSLAGQHVNVTHSRAELMSGVRSKAGESRSFLSFARGPNLRAACPIRPDLARLLLVSVVQSGP